MIFFVVIVILVACTLHAVLVKDWSAALGGGILIVAHTTAGLVGFAAAAAASTGVGVGVYFAGLLLWAGAVAVIDRSAESAEARRGATASS
jgi:hypothetical protein